MHEQIIDELREIKELLQLNWPVLSLQQFCKLADISEQYGYRLTSARKIPFSRPFGKKIYINREDAIAVLQQNRVESEGSVGSISNNYLLKNKKLG